MLDPSLIEPAKAELQDRLQKEVAAAVMLRELDAEAAADAVFAVGLGQLTTVLGHRRTSRLLFLIAQKFCAAADRQDRRPR